MKEVKPSVYWQFFFSAIVLGLGFVLCKKEQK